MNEKIVEINGISVSNIGFKDLQFETSRTSNGVKAIRGFGSSLNEENLNIIDTVAISFVVNAIELKNIAKIYQMFKVCGVLPIYNEYLLNKMKSTYRKGKTDEEIKNQNAGIYKDLWIKEDTEYFLCLLQKIEIHSLEKTADGYNVNMILTLFDKSLNKNEYDSYIYQYKLWSGEIKDDKTNNSNFDNVVTSALKNIKIEEFNHGNIDLKIYNVERLNQIYKDNVLNTFISNNKIKENESEYVNEKTQDEYYNKIKEKIKDTYKSLTIENKHILQIELMTTNLLSSVPIIGAPIGYKSYLGVGDSFFNVKLIFKEEENNIVEELKRISDKNIIDHKIEIEHPLIQLFDFYSANIVNIVFNNLEQANGIMVSIVFSLNGFKYSDESTINSESFLSSIQYTDDYKQERIGGLYLEILSNYLINKQVKDNNLFYNFLMTRLETSLRNQRGKSSIDSSKDKLYEATFTLTDLFSSYISFPTCVGYFNRFNSEKLDYLSFFITDHNNDGALSGTNNFKGRDLLNMQFNLNIKEGSNIYGKDVFFINDSNNKTGIFSQITDNSPFYNSNKFIQFIDNVSAITICSNDEYKKQISKIFKYNNTRTASFGTNTGLEILNDIIRKLSVELFNSKQNFENDEMQLELSKRMYETFYIKIFDILNNNKSINEKIEKQLKNKAFYDYKNLPFNHIKQTISDFSSTFFEMFLNSFYDENFIERLVEQIIKDYDDEAKKITESKEENKNLLKEKAIEFIKDLRIELKSLYSKNKTVIEERTYNIFLTKIIHILYSFQLKSDIYGIEHPKTQIDNYIKISILSSSILSILLLRTSKRTDKFENNIILGIQNIGYKISLYNQHISEKDKDGKLEPVKLFYEYFKTQEDYKNIYYYTSVLTAKDIEFNIGSKFNKNNIPKKDINYIYKNKLNPIDTHIKVILFDILDEQKTEEKKSCDKWLKEQKDFFLKEDDEKYSITNTDVKNIKIPKIYFGFLPSFFSKLFYKSSNDGKYIFKSLEKERIIANSDPFKEFESIYNVVLDSTDYTIPDYSIIVSHKIYNSEYTGDFSEINTEEVNIVLTNVVSINIVKNPKDKIKTANIVINNISKSIFNFNPEVNSFDIKVKRDGHIDIVRINPGDELRIRLGYGDNKQVFNGFINKVMVNNSTLVISASSFASSLYATKISELILKTDTLMETDRFRILFNDTKSAINETDEKMKNEILSNPQNKSLNDFLFKFLPNSNHNGIFIDGEKASMYSATILSLGTLSNKVLSKFTKVKKENITEAKLATDLYLKRSLQSPIGSFEIDATKNFSPLIYENLNNVDADYETYGMNAHNLDVDLSIYNNMLTFQESKKEEDVKTFGEKYVDKYLKTDKDVNNNSKNESVNATTNNIVGEITTEFVNDDSCIYKLDCYPVNLNKGHKITSLYKENRKNNRKHNGIDIGILYDHRRITNNFSIFAVKDGEVIETGNGSSNGIYVKIKHKIDGEENRYFISKYLHLKEKYVKKGDIVEAKQEIGYMGNTGLTSRGLHLHFELENEKQQRINPFDIGVLPEPVDFKISDIVSWTEVGSGAENGRYTNDEIWKKNYKK